MIILPRQARGKDIGKKRSKKSAVFSHLQVLGSEYTRKVLLDNANALEEHDRKRREVQEEKRQKEKIFFAQNPGAKRKSQLDTSKVRRKRTFLRHFTATENYHFTKTGSGQIYTGKQHSKKEVRFLIDEPAREEAGAQRQGG